MDKMVLSCSKTKLTVSPSLFIKELIQQQVQLEQALRVMTHQMLLPLYGPQVKPMFRIKPITPPKS